MYLAISWLLQGALLLALAVGADVVARRWRRCNDRLVLVGNGLSLVGRIALLALPFGLGVFVIGLLAFQLALAGLGSAVTTIGVVIVFAATCALGLVLPNVPDPLAALERSR